MDTKKLVENETVVSDGKDTQVKKTTRAKKPTSTKKQSEKMTEASLENIVADINWKVADIDPNQYVTVKNGFQGQLIYVSKRTGEKFVWDDFGDEQEMELHELKNAKNSFKSFFQNNWFMFDDEWVIDYLGVKQYYKNAINIEEFDEIFNQEPEKVYDSLINMSDGQKQSASYRARVLMAEKKIDSIRTIECIEKALGVELIER